MSCPDPYRRRAGRPATCAPMLRPARQTHRVGAVLARISGLAEEPAPQMALARTSAEADAHNRSEEHTSELQSLMRISYAVFCLKKKTSNTQIYNNYNQRNNNTTNIDN